MPRLTNKMLIDNIRIQGEFIIMNEQMSEMREEFGLKKICADTVFNALEEELNDICYPFLKGLKEINEKIKKRSEELLS